MDEQESDMFKSDEELFLESFHSLFNEEMNYLFVFYKMKGKTNQEIEEKTRDRKNFYEIHYQEYINKEIGGEYLLRLCYDSFIDLKRELNKE